MISVIIPCFNVEKYVTKCLDSVLSQTIGISELEIILIDDASTDGTLQLLYQYEKKYPKNIVLIPFEENQRQGTARNVGMLYATGDYISFVDSDDWIEADMYEKLLAAMEQEDYDYVACRGFRNYENGSQAIIERKEPAGVYVNIPSVVEGGEWFEAGINGGVYLRLYKKSFLMDNDLRFAERLLYEDNYFVSIASLYTRKIKLIDDCLYHYRENNVSTTMGRNNYSQFDRLTIEEMKLEKYKLLGIFDRFHDMIEKEFFRLFYFNTLYIMAVRFDIPPYEVYLRMRSTVLKWFPDYKTDSRLISCDNSLYEVLLGLLDMQMDEHKFRAIMSKYASMSR
ncbi:MAG: glycosyltransferase [Lachnospiraceae bacterium]|nr:glycosyltransferase [Lachnospiraceae bacterium]